MIRFILVFLVLLSGCSLQKSIPAPSQPELIRSAKAAPEFQLPDLQGRPVALYDFRGKVVLLQFWATWCMVCVEEMPALQDLKEQFSPEQFQILTVNLDRDLSAARKFAEKRGLDLLMLRDTSKQIQKLYAAYELPHAFLIDKRGHLVRLAHSENPGFGMRGAQEWRADDISSAIKQLMAEP